MRTLPTPLPFISLAETRNAWTAFLLRPDLSATYIVTGTPERLAALLLPFPAAATVAGLNGQPDVPTFRLENALDVLPDLVYRAARLNSATAITHQGRTLAAVAPLEWADDLNTERSKHQ